MARSSTCCAIRHGSTGRRAKISGVVGCFVASFVAAWCVSAGAAAELPDLLSLRRLETTALSDTEAEALAPLVNESVFLPKPTGKEPVDDTSGLSDARQQFLNWWNEYAKNQTLFLPQDLAGLRQAILTMSDEELARWDTDSAQLRERLMGESWQATQVWLREFLAAQAIYGADQIEALRSRLASLPPSRLMRVLDHFETVHFARIRSGQAAEQFRMQRLALVGRWQRSARSIHAARFRGGDAPGDAGRGAFVTARNRKYDWLARRPYLAQGFASFYVNRAIFGRGWGWWLW